MTVKSERTRGTSTYEERVKVLADTKRRRVLLHVRDRGPIAPSEVAIDFGWKPWVASYAMRVLAAHGFLECVKEEPVRGSTKHWYVATERHLIEDEEWKAFDPIQKQAMLAEGIEPLLQDMNRAIAGEMFGEDGAFHLWRTPLRSLDRQGYEELLDLHRRLAEEVDEIASRAAERLAGSTETPISATSASQCFEVPGF